MTVFAKTGKAFIYRKTFVQINPLQRKVKYSFHKLVAFAFMKLDGCPSFCEGCYINRLEYDITLQYNHKIMMQIERKEDYGTMQLKYEFNARGVRCNII